MKNMMTSIRER